MGFLEGMDGGRERWFIVALILWHVFTENLLTKWDTGLNMFCCHLRIPLGTEAFHFPSYFFAFLSPVTPAELLD